MRKFVAVMIVVMGMSIGVLVAYKDSWVGRFVMMGFSLLFTAPIAGIVAGIGKKGRIPFRLKPKFCFDDDELPGLGISPNDLDANFWRDKGYPAHARPLDPPPDKHRFDPQNLN